MDSYNEYDNYCEEKAERKAMIKTALIDTALYTALLINTIVLIVSFL